MQFPMLDFGLDHYGSQPFNCTAVGLPFFQAVKRLMTFCQRKWETDPSKCVEYHGIKAGQR